MITGRQGRLRWATLRREPLHGLSLFDWVVWRVAERRGTILVAAAAAVILACASVLRLIGIDRYGFNSDEAVYAGQAAALAGDQSYARLFGVFRAHPLLVHLVVSLVYRLTGVDDLAPRLVCVGAGVALVAVGGALGWVTRGRAVGLVTMLFLALSAYPIAISRQMLLDGPMALLVAVSVLLLALYVRRPRPLTLYLAAAFAGLALLAKETAILLLPGAAVFFCLAHSVPIRLRDLVIAAGVYVLTISPFPLSLLLAGGRSTAQNYLVWQVFRPANHPLDFYATLVPSIGFGVLLLAVAGLRLAARRRDAHDILLLSIPTVLVAFFEFWPVKGFEYLLPALAPVVVIAAEGTVGLARLLARPAARARPVQRGAGWVSARLRLPASDVVAGAALVVIAGAAIGTLLPGALSFASPTPPAIVATGSEYPAQDGKLPAVQFTAGTGGLAASRPVGYWVRDHTLPGARLLTIGPSLANVIQFYSLRHVLALSVSSNPLHRNPTYQPVRNPDLLIREGVIQYLVYDSYSAARSPHFAGRLMRYVAKYHGIDVFTWSQRARAPDGALRRVPVVRVFEVHQ